MSKHGKSFFTKDGDSMSDVWHKYQNSAVLQNAPCRMTAATMRRFHVDKKCPCCGEVMRYGGKHRATIDHILPKSRFPHLMFDYTNLQVICEVCNKEKGNSLPKRK